MANDPIIGIDLGTSNTVAAFADSGSAVKILADDAGYKIHPSVVSFHPNGGVVVGASAKQRKVIDPQNTIYSAKRLIGRSYNSPEVQTAKGRVPYQIKEGPNALPLIATRGGEFAVPEISAIILDHAKTLATARLGRDVTRAVVTVPASFNDAQRSATATAGAIAGLTIVRVLNEPTAAALAYGHTRNLREIIAVYDFGGGTFDITLLRLEDQVYEVLGTAGDTFLGGDDLDERLVDKMVSKFLAENRIDLRTNEVSMMRLRAVAEQTKIELSRRSRAVVRIDEIAYGPRGVPLNLQIEISRDEFVGAVSDIIDRTFPVCQEALALAGIGTDQIADVILVGGTTKIPYVRDQVSRFFAKAPRTDVNPEDAVAVGAALQATSLERILSRPRASSRQVPIVVPENLPGFEDPTMTDANIRADQKEDPSGAVMAPSELSLGGGPRMKRPTAAYPQNRMSTEAGTGERRTGAQPIVKAPTERIDTSYSVQRGGVRDEFPEGRTRPNAPNPLTNPTAASSSGGIPAQARTASLDLASPAIPLGRLTQRAMTPVPGDEPIATSSRPTVDMAAEDARAARQTQPGTGAVRTITADQVGGQRPTGAIPRVPTARQTQPVPTTGPAPAASRQTQPGAAVDGPRTTQSQPVVARTISSQPPPTPSPRQTQPTPTVAAPRATSSQPVVGRATPPPMPAVRPTGKSPALAKPDESLTKTAFGVPPPPGFPSRPPGSTDFDVTTSAGFQGEEKTRPRAPSVPPPARPWLDEEKVRTEPRASSSPGIEPQRPRTGQMSPLSAQRPPTENDDFLELELSAPTGRPASTQPSPASTQPLSPLVPIAAATAPTMMISRDLDDDFDEEPRNPASTAKGFQPPERARPASAPPPQYPFTPNQALAPAAPSQALASLAGVGQYARSSPPSTPPPVAEPTGYQSRAYQEPTAHQAPAYQEPAPPPAPQRPMQVLEVTPRSLGIGTVAGFCEELIRRNARLPSEMKKLFVTSRDNQENVRIVVCQGESRRLDNNTVIGDLVLQNLPKRPRGETAIEVTFQLDASGILQVRARDSQTGREQRASLDLVGNLPQQDVSAARDRVAGLRR